MKKWLYYNGDYIAQILLCIAGFSLFSGIIWAVILYGLYNIFLLQSFAFVFWLCGLIGSLLFIAGCIDEIMENGKKNK